MKLNRNFKFSVISLGCPKNLVDTEATIGLLEKAKHKYTDNLAEAEFLIVNTCAFIKEARNEAFATIRELSKYKNKRYGSCKYLIVLGCLPQWSTNRLIKQFPEVDCLVGSADFYKINEIVESLFQNDKKNNSPLVVVNHPTYIYDHSIPRRICTLPHTAYVKIAEGCDNRCSYCLIPRLRGSYRSRKKESIVTEVKNLVAQGVKEINLVAHDTTYYGVDIYGKPYLANLLKELVKISGLAWIRVLYMHPAHINDEIIDAIAENKKICKYIDMPIQHIDDGILFSMGRKITGKEINKLIKKIRYNIPEVTLRTTVMVGYPGETEKSFNNLIAFLQEAEFDRLGIFKYSREKGTVAYSFDNQIDERIKLKRIEKLISVQEKIIEKKYNKLIGNSVTVLIDNCIQKNGDVFLIGRTEQQAPDIDGVVYININENLNQRIKLPLGKFVNAKIKKAEGYDLFAELVSDIN